MATQTENNEVMQEMKQNLAQKIKDDVLALLEKYKEPCLALKMSINIDASVNVVYYSGNGRRSNPPMTIAETKANYSTHGIINWND
jgi:hypothetical protein